MSDMKLSEAPMSLSSAIRLGAMLRPQAFGWFFDKNGGSCAQGAALEAVGVTCANGDWSANMALNATVAALWPETQRPVMPPRGCISSRPLPLGAIIARLNNNENWPRERIADWLETIEQAQSSATPKEVFATKESV